MVSGKKIITNGSGLANGWWGAKNFDKISENQVIGSYGLRPDLVLARISDKKMFIIDVTIPFDNKMEAFTKAAEERKIRYQGLAEEPAQ